MASDRAADALEKFRANLQELIAVVATTNSARAGRLPFLSQKCRALSLFAGANIGDGPTGMEPGGRIRKLRERIATKMSRRFNSRKISTTWIKDAAAKELQIREFLDKHGILTVPDWLQHYTLRPMPEYLRASGL